ncbi:MAG TPA: phosphate-starvation-inducible PsiE family protein [Candidatus Acidoferrales bacterium]|nr:phosphate-starvation-inducible PsiE family protein [Candidatus Acidoferrales bacterium]
MKNSVAQWRFSSALGYAESAIYIAVGIFLVASAAGSLIVAAQLLWQDVGRSHTVEGMLPALAELLIALMLVEILHTVRVSIRSHTLLVEPFLVVGIIASIRRILVISLEMATLTEQTRYSEAGDALFRHSMTELGILGALILALVISIVLVRRYAPSLAGLSDTAATTAQDETP